MLAMRRPVRVAIVTALCLVGAPSLRATDAATIAAQGNGQGAAPCQSCHGANGAGMSATGFPRLAGLDAGYLRKQLDDFATGTRDNPVMHPNALALSADERQAMATYYAQMPMPKIPSVAPPSDKAGELLATHGRWAKQVPACVQCHGPGGMGVGASFPPLSGQSATYLESQLRAWKAGTRHNDPLQLMQGISRALDDNDIKAVAAWFAAQPITVARGTP
jgi:cytochrome c553